MTRSYQKKVGPGQRQKYNEHNLKKAVLEVRKGTLSAREASRKYEVPRSTIGDRLNERFSTKIGRPTALSVEDEEILVDGILLCAKWGFPLQKIDIRLIVKDFLDRKGQRVTSYFPDNMPGEDWMNAFISRHEELTVRLGENIKRVRAAVSRQVISEYFSELEKNVEDVPPSNIINYDESNFTDDAGHVKVVVRRGSRHPERIMDNSKQSTSVMMACTAAGKLLPPYVVYKATYLYPTWVEGGIENSVYCSNKSGWFDLHTFEDWFLKICLPYCKSQPGRKLLMGDNLTSHFSLNVIKLCQENNISFVLLPPNATHLCQPLDVAFFRPMKISWRKVLQEWKMKNKGVLPKADFPRLLKAAVERMGDRRPENIQSGFRACGIFPLDTSQVLKHIPATVTSADPETSSRWSDTLHHLEKNRLGEPSRQRRPRGARLDVVPGRSVQVPVSAAGDLSTGISAGTSTNQPSSSASPSEDESDTEADSDQSFNSSPENVPVLDPEQLEKEDFVLVELPTEGRSCSKFFVGQIKKVSSTKAKFEVKFMRVKKSKEPYFIFPAIDDLSQVKVEEIKQKLLMRDFRRGRYICDSVISYDNLG